MSTSAHWPCAGDLDEAVRVLIGPAHRDGGPDNVSYVVAGVVSCD
jgi:hypothetical protein